MTDNSIRSNRLIAKQENQMKNGRIYSGRKGWVSNLVLELMTWRSALSWQFLYIPGTALHLTLLEFGKNFTFFPLGHEFLYGYSRPCCFRVRLLYSFYKGLQQEGEHCAEHSSSALLEVQNPCKHLMISPSIFNVFIIKIKCSRAIAIKSEA